MADTFGAQTFPALAPAVGVPAGDVAIGVIAAYLKAALNYDCLQAWKAQDVCPGRQVVATTFTHDPKRLFDDDRLPSLYVWEDRSHPERIAADFEQDKRRINVFWVMEPAQDDHEAKRTPIFNIIGKSIRRALVRGRHLAWIQAGDTDPLAATFGSLVFEKAGISRLITGDAIPQLLEVFITDGEGKPLGFPGLGMFFEIVEFCAFDPTYGTYPAAVDATFENAEEETLGEIEDIPA